MIEHEHPFIFTDRCKSGKNIRTERECDEKQHETGGKNTYYTIKSRNHILSHVQKLGEQTSHLEKLNEIPPSSRDYNVIQLDHLSPFRGFDASPVSSVSGRSVGVSDMGEQDEDMEDEPVRHQFRRTSLLGRPIAIRNCRNETKYRKLQAQIYNFLERPKTWPSLAYHALVFASVFGCLILSILSTIEDFARPAGRLLLYMELAILFWFFTEYCIRLWSAGCRSRYQTWKGRFRFARRPFCIVDSVVLIASVVVLSVDTDRNMFAASALRGLRFFQILRMIRMDRRGGSFKLLASVVWAHRQELFTTVYIGFLFLIFTSFLIYLVEKKENGKITSYADALWWGVITLCTVGYGDTVPKTALGKIIAAFCAVAGISFFALPAGILGSGFALKVQQHQRQKHLIRRRVPAAALIQCLWRCYAADPSSSSVATWKVHSRLLVKPIGLTTSSSMIERGGLSRFSRFSTLKRRHEKPQPVSQPLIMNDISSLNDGAEPIPSHAHKGDVNKGSMGEANEPSSAPADQRFISTYNFDAPIESHKLQPLGENLLLQTPTNLHDSIKGLDANSSPKSHSENQLPMRFMRKPSSFRIRRQGTIKQSVSPLVDNNDAPDASEPTNPHFINRELTSQEKIAIRVIRKMQFLVARRNFREALRPYDVKDVIEQYSAGHLDMLSRVKLLQSKLDQILGRPGEKSEDTYDSRQSLASRVVKIERKIDSIEQKVDRLLNMYRQDRSEFRTHNIPKLITSEVKQSEPSHQQHFEMKEQSASYAGSAVPLKSIEDDKFVDTRQHLVTPPSSDVRSSSDWSSRGHELAEKPPSSQDGTNHPVITSLWDPVQNISGHTMTHDILKRDQL